MANALVDYFLQIDGVEGESTDQQYPGLIQIQSWQWAEENSGRWGFGSGGGAGKVEMKDFEFRMVSNKASPKLFLMCATGDHIASAKLICRKSGKGQQEFLTISFASGLVSSFRTLGNMPFSQLGHGSGEVDNVLPTDEIKINFAQIEFEYREQRNDGTMGAVIKAGYDLKLNAPI
ncbi:type VI secretion protein [Burkholderia territorii]|uniref:Hcp family type VI secretion system effector n=1 Tax=Burkholderia cepacia complex TaxID=87882 RepID=UPI000755226A|nr:MULTISPECIES: type VI secretion system tube protein Hcp [Burkholderia cepacia complex]AOI67569.1 type VI secretion protein [Burkholderia territorii]KVG57629.1 type VI secretion protein [Burkholderia territorii]KWB12317.1 type VI secretion protein [Burkholderia cepacia]TXG05973.1 type VI secretion system tube protein Hcp [Burkholderia territorii]HDR8861570.1 type VI secretion system tube protein Hcp [Burkholderia territorii]